MEDKIICPLVKEKITPVDCMENRDLKEINIPNKFKQDPNWKEICQKCKYYNY